MSRAQLNLLFIFTDQQRADTLGCYGNAFIHTPHIDRFAASATVVENAYVTQPVCTPSRASLLTGWWPHAHGCIDNNVPLPAAAPTLAERVSPEYARAYMGKWHLGDEVVPQRGFETWVSIEDYYRDHYSRPAYSELVSSYHHFLVAHGLQPDKQRSGATIFNRERTAQMPEPLTKASFLGQAASAFLRTIGDRPFVLYVAFLEPHRPYHGPLDALYPPEQLPVGPAFRQPPPGNAARVNQLLAEHYLRGGEIDDEDLTTEAGSRRTRAKYLGNVTLVDRAVGQILRALEDSGLADNTIVVYTSDHGDLMGDHGLFEKCVLYEEAVRVPLLIRAPQWPTAPRRLGGRFSQIDLVPTLLDLLDLPAASELPGHSRRALLDGTQTVDPQSGVVVEWNGSEWRPPRAFKRGLPPEAFTSVRGPWRTWVSNDGWKLNLSAMDQCELYDLNTDPYEQVNRFDDPSQHDRRRAMHAQLRRWQAQTADPVVLPEVN